MPSFEVDTSWIVIAGAASPDKTSVLDALRGVATS